MGYGYYTSADWVKLKKSGGITTSSSANEIFKNRKINPKLDPKFIASRLSCDSEDHPDSTPIIIGLDVTGSMGYLAERIAKDGLHETMMKLFSTKPVRDPQVLFAAIGDCCDSAPLQVTQFESDIRIAEQLLQLWLEGRGGDGPEDYPLLWYFATRHTTTDRYEKRHKKGYLFTIGDNDCHQSLQSSGLRKVFGEVHEDVMSVDLAKEASEKYRLFHISINTRTTPMLETAIPGRIINIKSTQVEYIPDIIVGAIRLSEGTKLEQIMHDLPEQLRPIIKSTLSELVIESKGEVNF